MVTSDNGKEKAKEDREAYVGGEKLRAGAGHYP